MAKPSVMHGCWMCSLGGGRRWGLKFESRPEYCMHAALITSGYISVCYSAHPGKVSTHAHTVGWWWKSYGFQAPGSMHLHNMLDEQQSYTVLHLSICLLCTTGHNNYVYTGQCSKAPITVLAQCCCLQSWSRIDGSHHIWGMSWGPK